MSDAYEKGTCTGLDNNLCRYSHQSLSGNFICLEYVRALLLSARSPWPPEMSSPKQR